MRHALCQDHEMLEGTSRGFELEGQSIFLVRRQNKVYAYRNRCPHLGINLEWQPDQFLDADACLIQCAMHGALFIIESGQCISGPCTGQSLTALPCDIENGDIWVQLPDDSESSTR